MKSGYVVSFSIACLLSVKAIKTQSQGQANADQEWWMAPSTTTTTTSPTTTTATTTSTTSTTTGDEWWLMPSSTTTIAPVDETSQIEEQLTSSLDFGSQDPLTDPTIHYTEVQGITSSPAREESLSTSTDLTSIIGMDD